jgi:hypothetical protein
MISDVESIPRKGLRFGPLSTIRGTRIQMLGRNG